MGSFVRGWRCAAGSLLGLLSAAGAAAQAPSPATHTRTRPAEIVLAGAEDPVPLAAFGLGTGGVGPRNAPLRLMERDDGCITPGGVRVTCRSVGVKITFAGGRDVLVAPDGFVHLRDGSVAGPFPAGLELWLADGSIVRVTLAQSRRERVRDVVVLDGETAVTPWRRGEADFRAARATGWGGLRLCCLGEGDALYRPIALGPLVVLDRVLCSEECSDELPAERLVVLTAALQESLDVMQRQHREPNAAVRQAITAVAAVAARSDVVFPDGAALARAEHDRLRWVLAADFELELALDGPMAPRLGLCVQRSKTPMIEWTLRGDAAAFLANPREDQPEKRWHGNGTRLPRIAAEWQAREHLIERAHALRVIDRLQRSADGRRR
jgi:hypothetical protein